MKIDVWSDVLCPFCYIGKRKLEAALAKFPHGAQVEVTWRSFELDPSAKSDPTKSIYEYLASKYGRGIEWAKQTNANLAQQAAGDGLTFDFDRVHPTNSFDAHRLLHLARARGHQPKLQEALFAAYFTHGQNVSDHATLSALAVQAGLDAGQVTRVLSGTDYTEAVRAEEAQAQSLGIRGVPAFVVDEKYLISGAQPSEVLLEAFNEIWAQTKG